MVVAPAAAPVADPADKGGCACGTAGGGGWIGPVRDGREGAAGCCTGGTAFGEGWGRVRAEVGRGAGCATTGTAAAGDGSTDIVATDIRCEKTTKIPGVR